MAVYELETVHCRNKEQQLVYQKRKSKKENQFCAVFLSNNNGRKKITKQLVLQHRNNHISFVEKAYGHFG